MLREHLEYVANPVRLERYRQALSAVVRPGQTVADLGCGTGVLGLLSLDAGASHVFLVDETPALALARATLGGRDQVSFVRGRSQQIELPEQVDVVVCDHVGWFGFDYGIVDLLRDARHRHLKPGGMLVPLGVRLFASAVESPQGGDFVERWRSDGVPGEMATLRSWAVNSKHPVDLEAGDVLAEPVELGSIDFRADQPDFRSWSGWLEIRRPGLLNGLGGWFECDLAAGVVMTSSPLSSERIVRSQAFLPIDQPTPVREGERIHLTIMARLDEGMIAWRVRFESTGRSFSHSTWHGEPLARQDLDSADAARRPLLNRAARARSTVLSYCDGIRTIEEVRNAVLRDHPRLFPSAAETSRFIDAVLARDTQ